MSDGGVNALRPGSAGAGDEIDIREYLSALWKNRNLIIRVTVSVTLIALIVSMFLPKVYEARTSILVRQEGGGGGLSNSLASLGALAGLSLPSSASSIKDDLIDLLNSDLIADRVIHDLGLDKEWKNIKNQEAMRIKLKGMAKIPARLKSNLIEIRVQSTNPKLAADIANAYVLALGALNINLGNAEASNKRIFIEDQMPKVQAELKQSEDRLKLFTALAPRSANVGAFGGGERAIPQSVEIARLAREVEVQSAVYTLLRKELEATKLEEAKGLEPFQVVDKGEVPTKKIKPLVRQNVVEALFLSFVATSLFVISKDRLLEVMGQIKRAAS